MENMIDVREALIWKEVRAFRIVIDEPFFFLLIMFFLYASMHLLILINGFFECICLIILF